MAVVEDFYLGETHIQIDNTYCKDTTPEEVDAILKRIAQITYPELLKQEMKRRKEEL